MAELYDGPPPALPVKHEINAADVAVWLNAHKDNVALNSSVDVFVVDSTIVDRDFSNLIINLKPVSEVVR